MKIKDVVNFLNNIAHPGLQESYDNSGMIVGDINWECKGVMTCLDSTEEVVDDAIANGCNLIVAHHPIVFLGLKSITGKNYIERVILKAIKNDVAIFAIHTNLDNVKHGVNGVWANALGLINQRILSPKKETLSKLIFYVPKNDKEAVLAATFEAGAGQIGNYSECHFSSLGLGSFKPNDEANPAVGKANERSDVEEERVEVLVENVKLNNVIAVLTKAHPYEEVAYDVIQLKNIQGDIGAGMIGELPESMDAIEWLKKVKNVTKTGVVRYTKIHKDQVKKVAICGGSGSFVLNDAIKQQADILITADFKYHQFFDAENKIIIADIGHYESEHLTINYLASILKEKFTTFAVLLTKVNTNPINYL